MKKIFTEFLALNNRNVPGISRSFCAGIFYIFLYFILITNLVAQPTIQWDKTIGGLNTDEIRSIKKTADGGYILGGFSNSNFSAGGDKSEDSKGGQDYWVVKLSAAGTKEWDKTFGGDRDDVLTSLQQTDDGGYILGGWSSSSINGNKTSPLIGEHDFWVVKLSATGTIEWDKTFGGIYNDELTSLQQTTDGGYILGGWTYSYSSDNDYLVIKLDLSGNRVWVKILGGSFSDQLLSLQQTTDLGFILGGRSRSSYSADKTEGNKGFYDYWVVKLSSAGIKQWDKTIGGNGDDVLTSLQQTADLGYILGGHSESGISGDKTEANKGAKDYWVVKLSAVGTKEWNKTIGGNGEDVMTSLQQTTDLSYILGGWSPSNVSGDKSQDSKGVNDYWIVNLNALGAKQWDKTIGGNNQDYLQEIQQTSDGGYILGGRSMSSLSADKSEASKGEVDYWIVKLVDCTNPVPSFTASPVCAGAATAFTDASTNVSRDATYAWDINNDGTVDYATIGSITHTYPAAGTYTAKLTIRQGGCEQSFTQQIIVNALPTATLTGNATICAGTSTNLSIALNGTGPWSVIYFDGNTEKTVTAESSPLLIPVSPASTTIYSLVSVSAANCTGTVSGEATVNVNTPPTAKLIGDATICAGTSTNLTFNLSGTGPWSLTYKEGQTEVIISANSAIVEIPVSPANTTTYSLVSVSDANCTGTVIGEATVTVNTPPELSVPAVGTINNDADQCGAMVALAATATGEPVPVITYKIGQMIIPASFFFPIGTTTVTATASNSCGTKEETFTVTVQDNQPPVIVDLPVDITLGTEAGKCEAAVYWIAPTAADNCPGVELIYSHAPGSVFPVGITTVTYTATDAAYNTASGSFSITITNSDPVLNAILAPVAPVPVNTAVSASASFIDNNLEIATWNWGDGQTTEGNINDNSVVTGSHTYTVPGVYTLTLTVQDFCGKTAERSFQYVVIYEPGGSFVTGGGWINSPAGAFVADPAVTGKASFGFVAKYQKGASVPTGSTEFEFTAADLDFHSRSYEWLVVSGYRAQFKGEGTVNGAGDYAFLLSAIDGQVSGGGGADKFRIKIWEKVSGTLVYDNNKGKKDDAAPATTLGGGSIVIHGSAGSARLAFQSQVAEASAQLKAYPNPFRDKTTVVFSFDQEQDYSLAVYDTKGTLVKTLQTGKAKAGEVMQINLEAAGLPVGVYFIRLATQEGMQHLRLIRE